MLGTGVITICHSLLHFPVVSEKHFSSQVFKSHCATLLHCSYCLLLPINIIHRIIIAFFAIDLLH
jgi:hypothetical protein